MLSILLIFISIMQVFQGIQLADVIFVTYDAGETNAFIPVYQYLTQEFGQTVHFIATATSYNVLKGALSQYQFSSDVFDLESFGIDQNTINQLSLDRYHSLSDSQVTAITKQIRAQLMITGLVSEFQKQVGDSFNTERYPWWGYYDGFSIPTTGSVSHLFTNNSTLITYLTPAAPISSYFTQQNSEYEAQTVGQPSFQSWQETNQKLNKQQERSLILQGANNDLDIIIFAGGYGDQYKESFELFVKSCESLDFNKYFVCVGLHPKVDGSLERSIIQQYNMQSKIRVLPKTEQYSLDKVVCSSQVQLSMQSTSGIQSLFVGKPAMYLNTNSYTNVAISQGLAPNCHDTQCFLKQIQNFSMEDFKFDTNRLVKAGIPLDGTQEFTDAIMKQLYGTSQIAQ